LNVPAINESTLRAVCDALRDPAVVSFVRDTVKAGYRECFCEHRESAASIASEAFAALKTSQGDGVNPSALLAVTTDLLRNVFRTHDKLFWFHVGYQQYKTLDKPEMDLAQLKPLIPGNQILDYGCGSGYLAARLDRAGYSVVTTDVLDYRYPDAQHLPFKVMRSASDICYPDDSADVTLIQAVLHHIDSDTLPTVLAKLRKVSSHLLIKEDTYGVPYEMEGVSETLESQPLMRRFTAFPYETQRKVLALIDYYANAIAQGVPEMHMPFSFRTPGEWKAVLEESGFRVTKSLVVGFERGRMHKSCHVWLSCERK
jgi:SAM-dependent methyltransferase